ncbi:phospholipid phosphatase 5-like [Manduca sexta]|uniref:phospholipid phosphatase 5-like n=1 Tax=Manduca sexta TaxID=7130 RepID=UPI00188E84C0|nr:phospholipid phosphatase 5-like [Manduca sexta]
MRRSARILFPNYILIEIFVRVFLLAVLCAMQFLKPHMHHITEEELHTYYKRPRQESYITPWVTILLIGGLPAMIIFVPLIIMKNYAEAIQAFLAWTLALLINAIITETVKLIVGRPRPDYFYRCYPDGNMKSHCKDVIEGRKSFPSGHSSFSFCSLGFLSMWLCGKLGVFSRSRGHGYRIVTCLVPLVIGGAVAISRWCDNHHHWEDILAGVLLGFALAYFCYRQYYLPLDSNSSGQPYVPETNASDNDAQECCTWYSNNVFRVTVPFSYKSSLN